MTEPAAVGYLGVAALATAVCAVALLVGAAVAAALDHRTRDRSDTHDHH